MVTAAPPPHFSGYLLGGKDLFFGDCQKKATIWVQISGGAGFPVGFPPSAFEPLAYNRFGQMKASKGSDPEIGADFRLLNSLHDSG